MTTFIIICLIAIAIEVSRRYFIVNKYCEMGEPVWMAVITSTFFFVTMICSYLIRDYISITVWMGAVVVYCICHARVIQAQIECKSEHLTMREIKQGRVYYLSWLIPLFVVIVITAVTICHDNRAFADKWHTTKVMTISCEPLRTIVNGNEIVVITCDEIPDDISLSVNKYGFDVLKLKKGDKIRYLKEGTRAQFKITTLNNKPYQK